jgi:hypothetical protein
VRSIDNIAEQYVERAAELDPGCATLLGMGERWNAENAWAFLRAHSSRGEQRLRFGMNRFLGWPGQAPSYKLGERIWLQARDEAKERAGDAFSLKDFHSQALSLGSMGLDPLREALSVRQDASQQIRRASRPERSQT